VRLTAQSATRRYRPLTQSATGRQYSSAASSQAKWLASRACISLLGRMSSRYSLFDHGTRSSWRFAMIWVGVVIDVSRSCSTGFCSVGPHKPRRPCEAAEVVSADVVRVGLRLAGTGGRPARPRSRYSFWRREQQGKAPRPCQRPRPDDVRYFQAPFIDHVGQKRSCGRPRRSTPGGHLSGRIPHVGGDQPPDSRNPVPDAAEGPKEEVRADRRNRLGTHLKTLFVEPLSPDRPPGHDTPTPRHVAWSDRSSSSGPIAPTVSSCAWTHGNGPSDRDTLPSGKGRSRTPSQLLWARVSGFPLPVWGSILGW
jgi:hypothetical protein